MGQRISRAKKTLAEARAEFELPTGAERTARLDDVMAVIYLIFNEGYTATAGDDWMRPDLAHEAMRLARMLVDARARRAGGARAAGAARAPGLAPRRTRSTTTVSRCCWRRRTAPAGTRCSSAAGWPPSRGPSGSRRAGTPVGRYFLQASIAAAARPRRTARGHAAGAASPRLYDVLAQAAPGPVVEVNRAVAHGRAFGPDAGLAVLDAVDPGELGDSPLVPSVRGDLLERAGLHAEAEGVHRGGVAHGTRASGPCCSAGPRRTGTGPRHHRVTGRPPSTSLTSLVPRRRRRCLRHVGRRVRRAPRLRRPDGAPGPGDHRLVVRRRHRSDPRRRLRPRSLERPANGTGGREVISRASTAPPPSWPRHAGGSRTCRSRRATWPRCPWPRRPSAACWRGTP